MGRGRAKATLELVDASLEILAIEQPTSVRAVAYRLFARGLIPNMSKASTNKVGRVLKEAREEGVIPWEWIVDETREAERINAWSDPGEIIQAAVNGYRRDYWQDQPNWIEVWSEKGTVRGILQPVLNKYGVTFRVMHGYASATVVQDIATETRRADKPLTALYVGDYDPSGMHMSEIDLPGRLAKYGGRLELQRIALTDTDVLNPALPHFQAITKKTDKRYQWFVRNYGHRAWELDAMRSDFLRKRVDTAIGNMLDTEAWQHAVKIEQAEVESMRNFHNRWKRYQAEERK